MVLFLLWIHQFQIDSGKSTHEIQTIILRKELFFLDNYLGRRSHIFINPSSSQVKNFNDHSYRTIKNGKDLYAWGNKDDKDLDSEIYIIMNMVHTINFYYLNREPYKDKKLGIS